MAKKYRTYIITKPYKSVYHFLKDNQFSENYITNLRKEMGYIRVNDEEVTIRKMLFPNDKLEINVNPNTKTSIMHCIIPLDIVYEDDYYLIVNKPLVFHVCQANHTILATLLVLFAITWIQKMIISPLGLSIGLIKIQKA